MDDASAPLIVTQAGPVTTFRLNRPGRLNALTPELHHMLQDAIDVFAGDEAQQIGVITGTGRAFCAGSDLKAMAGRGKAGGGAVRLPRCGYAGLVQRFDLDKPMIAAVNGTAMGGGFEIALCCDLIIAADTARFGLPEPQAGFVAVGGGPHRLVRDIGMKRAMEIVLTGRHVPAEEGKALGFVNEVVPGDMLDAVVHRWTETLLRGGPLAVRASKAILCASLGASSLPAAIGDQNGLAAMRRWRASDEPVEGPRAFAERRAPQWVRA